MPNPTIVTVSLDDKELRDSITKLVNDYKLNLEDMKSATTQAVNAMTQTIKSLGNIKIDMTGTLDGLEKAKKKLSGGTTSGTASGTTSAAAPDTIGALKEEIRLQQKKVDEQVRGTVEAQHEVNVHRELQRQLKEETKSELAKREARAKRDLKYATTLPMNDLQQAQYRLRELTKVSANWQGKGILDFSQWNRLNNAIDKTKKKIEQLKAAQPQSLKQVLGMDEHSLDAIARKMQAISNYRGGLNTKTQAGEIRQLNAEYNRLAKMQNELIGRNTLVSQSNNALARSFSYIRNRIAYALTIGAASSFVKQVYEIRGQYEMLERSLGVLVNSFQKGSQIFNQLNQMALKSPFTLIELGTSAKQLTAYNFKANEVVDVTRRLADISAALGVPMERLTYNLGQIRAQTVLTARDARDFANAGLPMVKSLADYYSELEGRVVSTGDVYDRMSKKMVSYNDVMAVLMKMTDEGGKFFDFQAKQADTLRVQIMNLSLAWNNMLNDIGRSNQGLLSLPVNALKELFQNWRTVDKAIWDVIAVIGVFKGVQVALNMVLGKGNAAITSSILAYKRKRAAMLEQEALTRTLSNEELALVRTKKMVTAADYQQVLSSRNLTKQQALMMVAFQGSNKELMKALVRMGLLTAAEVRGMTTGKAFTLMFRSMGLAVKSLAASLVAALPALGAMALIGGLVHLWQSYNDEVRKTEELNNHLVENSKENAQSISKFFDDYKKSLDSLKGGNLGADEQEKLWQAMREQIELSVASAVDYLAVLNKIGDVSDRIKAGENVLKDARRIQEVVKEIGGSNGLQMGQGEIVGQGIAKDLEQYVNALDEVVKHYGDTAETWNKINEVLANPTAVGQGDKGWEENFHNLISAAKEAQSEISATTESIAQQFSRFHDQILGDEPQRYAANIREYATQLEQALLSSEEGQKLQGERLAALKIGIDNWVAKTIEAETKVIDFAGGENERKTTIYLARTKTAWEEFYKAVGMLSNQEQERMKQLIESGAYLEKEYSEEFMKLWRKAANSMKDTSTESYNLIRNQINSLSTARIVIPVFFRQMNDVSGLNALQKDFAGHFYGNFKHGGDIKEFNKRIEQRLQAQRKYGKYQMKDGEDAVKWQKRINDEYKTTQQNLVAQNSIMSQIKDKSSVRYKEAQKQAKLEQQSLDTIKEVASYEGFTLESPLDKKNAKTAGSAAKKQAAAARKAQREAESELQKAFKDELQLIDKVRSQYKKLTDAGVSRGEALTIVTRQFGNSIEHINKVLGKNGLPLFDINSFTGTENPRALLKLLNSQLQAAKVAKNVKPVEIKDLELKIGEIEVEAKAYDTKKVLDGLKSSFDNLEKEYELSLELDANPEFGDMFTGIFNIPTNDLPKTFKEFYERANAEAEKALREIGVDTDYNIFDILGTRITGEGGYAEQIGRSEESLKSLIDIQEKVRKRFKDIVIATEKDLDDYIKKYGDYSDKIAEIEAGRLEKLKRLNDRYALANRNTPEYRAQLAAIEQGAAREAATAEFEAFKNSRFYEEMFENIEYASTASLKAIVERLNELKGSLKDLSPEQMKYIVQQTEKINTELLKRNPFKGLANNVRGYIEALKKGGNAQKEFLAAQKNYNEQEKIVTALKAIRKLKLDGQKLDEANIKHVAKISGIEENSLATAIREEGIEEASAKELDSKVEAAQALLDVLKEILAAADKENQRFNLAKKLLKEQAAQIVNVVGSNLQSLGELKSFLTEDLGVDIGAEMEGMFDGLQKTGQGMQSIVSSLTSGNVVGALVGVGQTFYGIYDSIASIFGGGSAKNKRIDRQIKDSEMQVKRLENAYKNLEFTVEQAYGTMAVGARQAAIANKELQLAELKRQLALEKSRDSKHRDEQRIIDLRGQIIDLKNEIIKSYQEIATDLLGISSVADAAESMMDAYISALRSGEDAMESFEGSVKDMVANIIKKLFVTKVIAPELERLVDDMNERITNRSSKEAKAYEEAVRKQSENEEGWSDDDLRARYEFVKRLGGFKEYETAEDYINAIRQPYEDAVKQAKKELDKATTPTLEDIEMVAEGAYAMIPALEGWTDDLNAMLEHFDLIDKNLDKAGNLSALSQGISGITEDTANAIESYLNGVSQQMYVHSDLLTQIRDAVVAMDTDVQLGVFSQMLLQLQNNYIVMQSMQSMMQNWTIPSGNGIRVELLS